MKEAARVCSAALLLWAFSGCGDEERTIYVTPTAGPDATATAPPGATATLPGATFTPTALATPTGTATAAISPTGSVSPTATPQEPALGPVISYLGVSSADDRPVANSGTDAAGRPIFERLLGSGLNIIVEARRGADNAAPGNSAYDQGGDLPDLQLLVSRPLGDGSTAVCDVDPEGINGGVPATDPPVFSAANADAINDLGCRVNDGTGAALGRPPGQACTRFASGDFGFVDQSSSVQFCLPIALAWSFPQGDTIVTARLRSVRGNLGDPLQIVVRVEREGPPLTPLATATPTPTPVQPLLTYLGIASADDRIVAPDGMDEQGRPIFERLLGHAFSLVVEGARNASGRPVGANAYGQDGTAPDLQILVSRDLGDGSEAVCDFDIDEEIFGGIPGIDPPLFSADARVIGALNDLGCRTNDGTGQPLGRVPSQACTRTEFGDFAVANPISDVQFCLPIAKAWSFPVGDTVVAARVRSIDGGLSAVEEIVIRVREQATAIECDESGLGQRTFSVARPDSRFLVPEVEGDVSTGPWLAEPLELCAGGDSGEGRHSLRLLQDAVLAFPVEVATVCVKLFAAGSGGVLDCGGGEGHDVASSLDAVSMSSSIEIGLGDPSGPGSATMTLPVSFRTLPVTASLEDCLDAQFGFAPMLTLSTATATGTVTNSEDSSVPLLALTGAAFDCSRWTDSESGGAMVLVEPLLAQPTIGDTVLGLVLED
jgi:hypothetical protein